MHTLKEYAVNANGITTMCTKREGRVKVAENSLILPVIESVQGFFPKGWLSHKLGKMKTGRAFQHRPAKAIQLVSLRLPTASP